MNVRRGVKDGARAFKDLEGVLLGTRFGVPFGTWFDDIVVSNDYPIPLSGSNRIIDQ